MPSTFRRSPLALAILGVLEVGPMHPYAIQRVIKEWGKDQVINVGQRATLYKMIGRLDEAGLIAVDGTDRDQRYPERTVYHATEAGSAAAGQWLVEILSTPRNEFPEFPAALSFLPLITPDAARQLLGKRRALLTDRLAEVDAELLTAAESYHLPRVTMLESEYLRAAIDAERRWVTTILEELADGSLTWSRDELVEFGTQQVR